MKECVITKKTECPHEKVTNTLCSKCNIPDKHCEAIVENFLDELIANQQNIPVDIQDELDEHFWELI